jgi:hypothetical protein
VAYEHMQKSYFDITIIVAMLSFTNTLYPLLPILAHGQQQQQQQLRQQQKIKLIMISRVNL